MPPTSSTHSPSSSNDAASAAAANPARVALAEMTRFSAVAVQLGLCVLVVRRFELEGKAFLHLMALTFGGFLVNHALPAKLRMPFFALLSIGGIGLVIGPANAAWVVALGLTLIGTAHLPLPFRARVALVVAVGALFAILRVNLVTTPIPALVWPLLGAMFMFRLIVYMFDLGSQSAPFSLFRSLAYFFLLPNICFTLFPVVDYQAFNKGHYNADAIKIYQRGVSSVLRGLLQFLLYRLIYQNLLVDPASITDLGDVFRHCLGTFGLYFRVIGSYSVVAGMIMLFGFNLPLPNHNFLLSLSFTDFWRRTNIYWKDFIQRLFFQPMYLALNKRVAAMPAMAIATVFAFIATWALHSYQWFWVRASFPITWQDLAMWTWLGIGVFAAMVLEIKRPKKKSLKKIARTPKGDAMRALKNTAMITAMMVMWTVVWTSPSWGSTKALLAASTHAGLGDVAFILACLVGFAVVTTIFSYLPNETPDGAGPVKPALDPKSFWRQVALCVGGAAVLLGLGYFPSALSFEPRLADLVDRVRTNKLSARDAALLKQGYYEDLTDATRFSPELAALYAARPKDWDVNKLVEQVDTFPDYRLKPSSVTVFKGAKFTTNAWGMRDKAYQKAKPPGTYRMVLLGQSVGQGSGVEDAQVYEAVTEARLNREKAGATIRGGAAPVQHWEILNFANGGFGPVRKVAKLDREGFDFSPDAVLYVSISDFEWLMVELLSEQADLPPEKRIPYPEIQALRKQAGVTNDMPKVVAERKLRPHLEEALTFLYRHTVESCRARGVRPLYAMLAQPEDNPALVPVMAKELALAKQAGFEVIDLRDVYAGQKNIEQFWVAKFDHHPNAQAHKMIADRLYANLVALLGL